MTARQAMFLPPLAAAGDSVGVPATMKRPVDVHRLVTDHQVGLWRYVCLLGAEPGEAEDLCQETFLAVLRRPFDEQGHAATAGYLRTVARHLLLKARRRQRRAPREEDLDRAEELWCREAAADGGDVWIAALRGPHALLEVATAVRLGVGDRLRSGSERSARLSIDGIGTVQLAAFSEIGVIDMEWKHFGAGAAIGSLTVAVVAGSIDWWSDDGDGRAEAGQAVVLARLSDYAFVDFTTDPEAYAAWWPRFAHSPADLVLTACASEWAARLAGLDAASLRQELERYAVRHGPLELAERVGVDLAATLRSAGLADVLARVLDAGDDAARASAWQWVAETDMADPMFVQQHATSLMRDPGALPPELQRAVFTALARQRAAWANALLREALVAYPVERDALSRAGLWDVARALADAGDESAIPAMIAMIVAHGGYATVYGIGHFGLYPLTGVPYDESHDGAWWLRWWEENRRRLPEPLRSQSIPLLPSGR